LVIQKTQTEKDLKKKKKEVENREIRKKGKRLSSQVEGVLPTTEEY